MPTRVSCRLPELPLCVPVNILDIPHLITSKVSHLHFPICFFSLSCALATSTFLRSLGVSIQQVSMTFCRPFSHLSRRGMMARQPTEWNYRENEKRHRTSVPSLSSAARAPSHFISPLSLDLIKPPKEGRQRCQMPIKRQIGFLSNQLKESSAMAEKKKIMYINHSFINPSSISFSIIHSCARAR